MSPSKIVACVGVSGAAVVGLLLFWAFHDVDRTQTYCDYTDPKSGLRIRVNVGSLPITSYMSVEDTHFIDDKMTWGKLRVIEYGDWLLVANDSWIVGGVNRTNRSVGLTKWNELPFTKWNGEGRILSETVAGSKGIKPFSKSYPIVESGDSTNRSVAGPAALPEKHELH